MGRGCRGKALKALRALAAPLRIEVEYLPGRRDARYQLTGDGWTWSMRKAWDVEVWLGNLKRGELSIEETVKGWPGARRIV